MKKPAKTKTPARKLKAPGLVAKAAPARPAKSPLSKAELEEFRRILLAKRRELVGDMNGVEAEAIKARQGGGGELSTMPTHLADLGTDNFEQEFTLGLLESERSLLREIDQALERIQNGTFGICPGTHKPISKARLRARPWAKYCIEYARMIEKGLVKPVPVDPVGPPGESEEPEEPAEEEPADEAEGETEFAAGDDEDFRE